MRLLPIALALFLALALALPATASPACGPQPGRKGTTYGCDMDGDGRADAWAMTTCGPANPTTCAVTWNSTHGGVTHEDSWDGQARQANSTTHGQASEAPIPGGLDRSVNGTFHCTIDGCATKGDTGSGPASLAINTTPHWTVDTMGPNLMYNGTAAADLDGDGVADLAASETCASSPPVALDCGSQGAYLLANGTGVRIKPVRCELQRCEAGASAPGGLVLATNNADATTLFVAAAGGAHGCTIRHEASQQAISNCK